MKIKPNVSERIAKHNQHNQRKQESKNEKIKQAMAAISKRRNAEQIFTLRQRFQFDKEFTAFGMLLRTEDMMERHSPRVPEDEFCKEFIIAAKMIDSINGMIEEIKIDSEI